MLREQMKRGYGGCQRMIRWSTRPVNDGEEDEQQLQKLRQEEELDWLMVKLQPQAPLLP